MLNKYIHNTTNWSLYHNNIIFAHHIRTTQKYNPTFYSNHVVYTYGSGKSKREDILIIHKIYICLYTYIYLPYIYYTRLEAHYNKNPTSYLPPPHHSALCSGFLLCTIYIYAPSLIMTL